MGIVSLRFLVFFLMCCFSGCVSAVQIDYDSLENTSECTLPATPEHGYYSMVGVDKKTVPGSYTNHGTILLFSCEPGYSAYAAVTAICIKGTWVTEFKQCQKSKHCTLPNFPSNGNYDITGQRNEAVPGTEIPNWTLVTFTCDALYDLIGSKMALCRDGLWTNIPPVCERNKRCHIPEPPKNGSYSIVASDIVAVAGTVVQEKAALFYKCDSGFILNGGSVTVCQEGFWLGGIPSCEVIKECDLPTPPENGNFSVLGSLDSSVLQCAADEKHTILYTCNPGYQLIGKEWSTCIEEKWTSNAPKCIEKRSCVLPNQLTNGQYQILGLSENATAGEEVQESTVLLFSCDMHFNRLGSNLVYCRNSTWIGDIPKCLRHEECSNVQDQSSGVFFIQPPGASAPFQVYCDLNLEGGRWTTIQSRSNGLLNFFRNYENYTNGFGSVADDHWLGLNHIHELTKDNKHELYIELENMDGKMYHARYSQFSVGNSESGFKLTVAGYTGTAGDSFVYHNGVKFSTPEKDQDESGNNCAVEYKGGWWFKSCHYSNLNGFFYTTVVDKSDGLSWYYLSKNWISFKKSRMLVRRKP